jgi:hypothetical protein
MPLNDWGSGSTPAQPRSRGAGLSGRPALMTISAAAREFGRFSTDFNGVKVALQKCTSTARGAVTGCTHTVYTDVHTGACRSTRCQLMREQEQETTEWASSGIRDVQRQ